MRYFPSQLPLFVRGIHPLISLPSLYLHCSEFIYIFYMDFFSRDINNVRSMTKKFSRNHGQPRNLQHNTLITKEKFNTIQHIHINVKQN